jgi:hypothetical protein
VQKRYIDYIHIFKRRKLNNVNATSSNKIGMMIFTPVQKPLIIEFSNILLDLKIILAY